MTDERDLLAALLEYSGSDAIAPALLQHFASIGHVITAEASQLQAFGLSGEDERLLRLVSLHRAGGSAPRSVA